VIHLYPGAVVAIACFWGEHLGIAAIRNGQWTLISNRGMRNGVTEELFEHVVGQANWRLVAMAGALLPSTVVARARSKLGTRYSFWQWNCEDFVSWALGHKPRSLQRESFLALAGVIVSAIAVRTIARKA
jgi:Lecithin retinol acyltransferase